MSNTIDEKIEQNFTDIESYLSEQTGVHLNPTENEIFTEAYLGELKGERSSVEELKDWISNTVHEDEYVESMAAISGLDENEIRTMLESKEVDLFMDCKTPTELNRWMDQIQYGWIDKSGNIQGTGDNDDEEDFFNEYRLQSPDQLANSKVGVCWDQTELERQWFNTHGFRFNIYYIEIQNKNTCPTHTFLVYEYREPGESEVYYHWFEHSWGIYKGIHEYGSLKRCFADIISMHRQANNDNESPVLITRMESVPKAGCTCDQFMKLGRNSPRVNLADLHSTDLFDEKYEPPYSYRKLPDHLKNDEVHSWRARTKIELIHQEPSLEEFNRIWINWNAMTDNQKDISDKKSIELFGIPNEKNYAKLLSSYIPSKPGRTEFYRVMYQGVGIYEAIKQAVSMDLWKTLLKSSNFSWLPKPPSYPVSCRSYFTEDGYKQFCINVLSILDSIGMESKYLSTSVSTKIGTPVYSDQYQVIIDTTKGGIITEESEQVEEPKEEPRQEEEPKEESQPKRVDREESDKNGVRRKNLYIAFIEWCKKYNNKNTFGSLFDKDIFHITYPFVPDEMRYFYRLANPVLCVLAGNLTFFQVSELKKLNFRNSKLNEMMIFAATETDMRVFNKKDKKVYRGTDENGVLTLHEVLGNTFDTYIQRMINQGDILNAPLDESADFFLKEN